MPSHINNLCLNRHDLHQLPVLLYHYFQITVNLHYDYLYVNHTPNVNIPYTVYSYNA